MATTTNYGWTTPDDTALVKDGAAAIRTLGTSVDTTTKNLNPSTTLGDIEYRSSTANTNTRLGIGSTGNILTVAGGVPTWAAPASAGGITQLATGSLNGVSSVTISSISQSYKHLYAVVQNQQSSAGATTFRPNNYSTGNYGGLRSYFNSASWGTNSVSTSASDGIDPGTDPDYITFFEIPNYTLTGYKVYTIYTGGSTSGNSSYTFGRNSDTTAVSSLVIRNGDGNNFSAGTYTLYGVS
jgi:hypothetical protein